MLGITLNDAALRSQKWPKTGRLAAGFRKGSIWDSPASALPERAQILAYASQTDTPFARTVRWLSASKRFMHRSEFVREMQWIRYAASVAFLGGLASERWINVLWALPI